MPCTAAPLLPHVIGCSSALSVASSEHPPDCKIVTLHTFSLHDTADRSQGIPRCFGRWETTSFEMERTPYDPRLVRPPLRKAPSACKTPFHALQLHVVHDTGDGPSRKQHLKQHVVAKRFLHYTHLLSAGRALLCFLPCTKYFRADRDTFINDIPGTRVPGYHETIVRLQVHQQQCLGRMTTFGEIQDVALSRGKEMGCEG